jgi:hybrid polyketide synthase / nonribosomal peptide synthetase ACE1
VVVNSLKSLLHRWPLSPQTVLQQTALSFDVSWWGALLGLATKGKVVVAGSEARKDPRALTNLIISKSITLTFAVPSESVTWLQAGDLSALRSSAWALHFSGGEPYSLNLIRHLQWLNKPTLRAINIYGPTETMIPTAHEVFYREISPSNLPVPIGRILPNYTARVVDEQGHSLPAGIPGHLVFSGAGIASGYVNNPSLTAERFPIDNLIPPTFLERGWKQLHRSGDRGYLRASDGVFMLQGRIDGDTQVKLRGLRIDMLDVESNILSTAKGKISDVVVHVRKPKENDASSEFLVAHVVLTKETSSRYKDINELSIFLGQIVKELSLPDYMRPAVTVAIDSLPLNHHGKVDRKAVVKLPLNEVSKTQKHQVEGVSGLAGTENQEKIKELWLNILGEAVQSHILHPDSDFFLVGGNSLLLLRLQSELKKKYGQDILLAELFQRNTVAQMAALLDSNNKDGPEVIKASVDWAQEITIQSELVNLRANTLQQPTNGLVVALTGTTGFLGRGLLKRLSQIPEIKTIHAIAVRNPTALEISSFPKLVIHPGDLSLPNLGLADETIRQIFSTAHVVIHNGADVSFLKAYDTVRSTNFISTKDIVRFSLQYGHVRHLHFVSTAGIATLLSRDLYEESLGSLPPEWATEGYILSKWANELYLENVNTATALPVTIHRPTAIVGENAPQLDVMTNVLHYSEKLRTVPSMSALEGTFQFVDIEHVARDISQAVLSGSTAGHSVHYRNHFGLPSDTVDIHALGSYLSKKLGTNLELLPDEEWISKAEASGLAPEVAKYLQGVNLTDRKGEKWRFPTIRGGTRPK